MAATHRATELEHRPDRSLMLVAIPAVLLIYTAAILAFPLLQSDEQLGLALLLAVPVVVVALYVITQAILGDRFSGAMIAAACIFMCAANLRARAYTDKSIDWQVGLKLVALALLFVTAAVFLSYAINRLKLGRLFYEWLVFFVWLVVCSLYSESVTFALTCSVSFLVCYIYSVYMTVWLSRTTTIQVMLIVALVMCIGSIVVYYAVPSMGRMQAWEGATFGDTGRMKGLTGSANAIGMIAAFSIVLAVLYYRSFGIWGRRMAIVLVPSALVCLILSNNRSSMLAVAGAFWFAYVCRGASTLKILASATVGVIVLAALVSFPDEIFSMLSRSGRAEEITSATGRSLIWGVILELSAQRPLLGYGYTSALSLLPTDPRLFGAAAHAHNMFLELLFAGGVVLLGLFLYALYRTFLVMYRLRAISEAALLVFFLIRGMTEAGAFGGMVGYTSFAFAITLALVISKCVRVKPQVFVARPVTSHRGAPELRSSRI